MIVPDGVLAGYLPTSQEAKLFWSQYEFYLLIPAYLVLLIPLSLLYFKTVYRKNILNAYIRYVILLTLESNLYLLLSEILTYFFDQSLPFLIIPRLLLFLVFPIFFIINVAWNNTIALYIRYLIILGFFIIFVAMFILGIPRFIEQIIFNSRFCLGYSCPVSIRPVVFTPKSYKDFIKE